MMRSQKRKFTKHSEHAKMMAVNVVPELWLRWDQLLRPILRVQMRRDNVFARKSFPVPSIGHLWMLYDCDVVFSSNWSCNCWSPPPYAHWRYSYPLFRTKKNNNNNKKIKMDEIESGIALLLMFSINQLSSACKRANYVSVWKIKFFPQNSLPLCGYMRIILIETDTDICIDLINYNTNRELNTMFLLKSSIEFVHCARSSVYVSAARISSASACNLQFWYT